MKHLISILLATLIANALLAEPPAAPAAVRPQLASSAPTANIELNGPVGFIEVEIAPGTNTVKSIFVAPHIPTLRAFLAEACMGDRIAFGSLHAEVKQHEGQLHWLQDGKGVDQAHLAKPSVPMCNIRTANKKSHVFLSGTLDMSQAPKR